MKLATRHKILPTLTVSGLLTTACFFLQAQDDRETLEG